MTEIGFTTRRNVMHITSIEDFLNIKGGMYKNCKDVYFLRMDGVWDSLLQDIATIDGFIAEKRVAGAGAYCRINELPKLVSVEDATLYAEKYEKWMATKTVELSSTQNCKQLNAILGSACGQALAAYEKTTPNVNETIRKNIFTKMLYWYDKIMEGSANSWNEKQTNKVIICGIRSKQEYFFTYLLTLTGIDVLILQTGKDIDLLPEERNLANTINRGKYGLCAIPKYEAKLERKGRTEAPPSAGGGVVQEVAHGKINTRRPERDLRTAQGQSNVPASPISTRPSAGDNGNRVELEFEELALLASSIVMIAKHNEAGDIIGTGSGIMIGKAGFILTNNHVASGGAHYSVRTEEDETLYPTDEVIKYNSVLDLAVIRIQRDLKPIPVYKGSKALARGQRVVAIGSPLGLFNSVSNGIISGFRVIENVDMIQFTAPISPGSSGGAVLNMYGEVIGISTAGIDNGQNINLAVGYEFINTFIQGFI